MDITNPESIEDYLTKAELHDRSKIDLIVHCAAYTNVSEAEVEREKCYQINVDGTRNITSFGIPVLHISTEYVFDGKKGNYKEADKTNPTNFYSETKIKAEKVIPNGSKIIRTLFKPRPFPYHQAFTDQWTSGDYVDIIAQHINLAIDLYADLPHIIHIGTGRKSIYELASKTRTVLPIFRKNVPVPLPRDTSLDTTLWNQFKISHDEALLHERG